MAQPHLQMSTGSPVQAAVPRVSGLCLGTQGCGQGLLRRDRAPGAKALRIRASEKGHHM